MIYDKSIMNFSFAICELRACVLVNERMSKLVGLCAFLSVFSPFIDLFLLAIFFLWVFMVCLFV